MSWSPDGRWLATGGEDAAVRLWDCASGAYAAVLQVGLGLVWPLKGAWKGCEQCCPCTRKAGLAHAHADLVQRFGAAGPRAARSSHGL